jgi:hypothetical protein
MTHTRTLSTLIGAAAGLAAALAIGSSAPLRAQPAAPPPSLTGGWTLNKNLSDMPPARGDQPPDGGEARGRRGGGYGGGGGGFGRGGMGGRGRFGGGGGGPMARMSPEDRERLREAMRDLMTPPDHLVITQTGKTVVITTGDGQVTRLETDGSKVKDDSTGIERRTKWDGARLVSEISGIGRGKITETFEPDPEHHQVQVTLEMPNPRSSEPRLVKRVYDADAAAK